MEAVAYDPLGAPTSVYAEVRSGLELLAGALGGGFELRSQLGKSAKQPNFCDCGVFVCIFGDLLMQGLVPEFSHTADDIRSYREKIAYALLRR